MRSLLRFAFGTFCAFALVAAGTPAAAQSIGSSMPAASQSLPNASGGGSASLSSLAGSQATAVIFWSNQCEWTQRYEERVQNLANSFEGQGVRFVLVNANSAADFPQESLAASKEAGLGVPYLKDESGQVAEAFGAARTPHVFVFNGQGKLAYTGAIDDSPGDPSAVKQPYLKSALEAITSGSAPSTATTNAFGCTLKN